MKNLTNIIEALLLISGDAVAISDIAEKTNSTSQEVLSCAKELQQKYSGESGIHLLIFNKKLQFCSNPDYAEDVSAVLQPIKERELSRSMLEVAAIVAYKQPVTRIDIEYLRGKNSDFAIQNLLNIGVIEVTGRKNTVGKPVIFGTTDEFLKRFQISDLNELPDYDSLLEKISKLRGSGSDSAYLFEKDEYVESDEIAITNDNFIAGLEELEKPAEEVKATNEVDIEVENNSVIDEADSDFLDDILEEEIPDFLQGEELDVIK